MANSVPKSSAVPDRILDTGQLTSGMPNRDTNLDIYLAVDCDLETPL